MSFHLEQMRRDDTCILTLADDSGLQLLDTAALNLLLTTLQHLDRDSSIKVLVLTSRSERAFSAGSNLEALSRLDADAAYEMSVLGQSVSNSLADFRSPVIAALSGLAYGGGLELAIAADFRISTSVTRFAYPATRLGILPGYGGTQRLPQLIGPSRAKELMLLGRIIDGSQALSWGLVNALSESPLELALDWARNLEARDGFALRMTKDCIAMAERMDFHSEQEAFSACFAQPGIQQRLRDWQSTRTDRDG
jgi:enoyl-CoA hydratase